MADYLTLENAGALDEFVENHPRGHYMQTSTYGKSRPDYDWNAIAIRDDSGRITASIALHYLPAVWQVCGCSMPPEGRYSPAGNNSGQS